ncbi:zinc finger protein 91-like [Galleria mellonella]|uniref:Zinc finger protein 91-like n=1 Tax=Galleria mellonella TaxID=7137 RepID=A0A6J1X503_GALME|nr:zinc finger protein 91-like [Galleria mellonella]
MSCVKSILFKLISNENDFCFLCYNSLNEESQNIYFVTDQIYLKDKDDLNMLQILDYVVGHRFIHSRSSDFICQRCTELAISCYRFIETCQKNIQDTETAIRSLNEHFEIKSETESGKAMIASLNINDFTMKQYYVQEINDKLLALQYFLSVSDTDNTEKGNLLTKETEIEIYIENTTKDINPTCESNSHGNLTISLQDMVLNENDRSIYKCKACFKIFSRPHNLRQHYMRLHAAKTYKCKQCQKSYGSITILKQHNYESHYNKVCTKCGKMFHNRTRLNMHEISHNLELLCQMCGKHYKSLHSFKKHVKTKICQQKPRKPLEQKFICDYCNKKYGSKQTLGIHIKFEHGNEKGHVCSWCGKRFCAKSKLKAHIVKHTREKNYNCDLCHNRFVTKESLLIHTRQHTGEKPYECSHCNQKFITSSRRAEHIRKQHLELI